jgi:hypothetical protein
MKGDVMNIRVLLPDPAPSPRARIGPAEVDDLVDHLFAAPSVDPGQVPMHVAARLESGEMRLALAVLEDALRCVLRHSGSRIREQDEAAREALAWMSSADDAAPFAFVRLCQLFDLDPDWLREMVLRRRPREDVRRSPLERAA